MSSPAPAGVSGASAMNLSGNTVSVHVTPEPDGDVQCDLNCNGREVKVHVEGQLVFNNIALRLSTALAGLGLACLPEDQVHADIAAGRLVRVLADWCPPFSGYHLYYPSRRQSSPAFALMVDALRYRR